jgi:hypothetical protein
MAMVAIVLKPQKGCGELVTTHSGVSSEVSIQRIQNRSTVKTMSNGSGMRAARAMGYEVGAIVSDTETGYRDAVDWSEVC